MLDGPGTPEYPAKQSPHVWGTSRQLDRLYSAHGGARVQFTVLDVTARLLRNCKARLKLLDSRKLDRTDIVRLAREVAESIGFKDSNT